MKKKILFLTPTLGVGGGERVVSLLSLNFSPRIETIIVVFENIVSYSYKGKLLSLDIPTKKNVLLKLYYFLLAWVRFKRVLRNQHPDAIISLGVIQNIIAPLATKKAILRVGNSLSHGYNGIKGSLLKIFMPLLFRRAEKIIAISEGLRKDLIKNFSVRENRIHVIHNPIDISDIRNSCDVLEPKYNHIFQYPVIINAGRINEQKGQEYLIRAFKRVREKSNREVKLVILGEGELMPYLNKIIRTLKLERDVFLLGWQKNPFAFLAQSTLFVLSSLWEGLGNIILEAMACGLPVISSDCPEGPRDILNPHTIRGRMERMEKAPYGILVPPKNEEIMSEAIIELLENKDLLAYYKNKSLARSKDFGVAHIIKQYESLVL